MFMRAIVIRKLAIPLLLGLGLLTSLAIQAAPATDKGRNDPYVCGTDDVLIAGAPLSICVRDSSSYTVDRDEVAQFYGGHAEGVYLWVGRDVWGPEQVPAGNPVNRYTPVSN